MLTKLKELMNFVNAILANFNHPFVTLGELVKD